MVETIALFGGTGATGSKVLRLALGSDDYNVKMMCRAPDKVDDELKKNDKMKAVIQGDFSNATAVEETVTQADYVIVCAGAKPGGTYPTDMMLKFIELLWPILQKTKPKVVLYQAGAFSPHPDAKNKPHPFFLSILGPVASMMLGIRQMVLDNTQVQKYIFENPLTPDTQTIVTRPGALKDAIPNPKEGMVLKVVGTEDAFGGNPNSFTEIAKFSLQAIKDESLYGKYPFVDVTYVKKEEAEGGSSSKSA